MKKLYKAIEITLYILIFSTTLVSQSQSETFQEYKHPIKLFSEKSDKQVKKYIKTLLKYENIESSAKYSEWLDDLNAKDKKILKSFEVNTPFVAYMKWRKGVVNRINFYKKFGDQIDKFMKIYVTYGAEDNFTDEFKNMKAKEQKEAIDLLAFSIDVNVHVMYEIFKKLREKEKSYNEGFEELLLAENLHPILESQINHFKQLKGDRHSEYYLRIYNRGERYNPTQYRDFMLQRDSIYIVTQEKLLLQKNKEEAERIARLEKFKKEEAERMRQKELQEAFEKKFVVGTVETIGPKVNKDWFNFIKNTALDVDAAVVGIDGPLKYYIRGTVKNISEETISFKIRPSGNITKVRETIILGMSREKRFSVHSLNNYLNIYNLLPNEERPFIIEIDPGINIQATGLNLGFGTGMSTYELSEYELKFMQLSEGEITTSSIQNEISKQNKWIANYLKEDESIAYELDYFGKKIGKYDGDKYASATDKLKSDIYNFSSCIEDIDVKSKIFECEGMKIERNIVSIKCDNKVKEFYLDEGRCLSKSSKGLHTYSNTKESIYYGNLDINQMIYLLCGCQ